MSTELIERTGIDIRRYPNPAKIVPAQAEVTLGDLHGNALKLLHFLLMEGVVRFKDSVVNPAVVYQQFVEDYDAIATQELLSRRPSLVLGQEKHNLIARKVATTDENEKAQLEKEIQAIEKKVAYAETPKAKACARDLLTEHSARFISLFKTLEVASPDTLVRLIGDEVSDRGSSDYLTLELLAFLQKNNVPVRILVSNHGADFITSAESLSKDSSSLSDAGLIDTSQKVSFLGLMTAFKQPGGCSAERLTQLVDTVYKPSLCLLDYTLSENGITLFTHAPVRFSVLRDLAQALKVTYRDDRVEALGETLDKMNSRFAKLLKENQLAALLNIPQEIVENDALDMANLSLVNQKDWPIVHLIWNRWNKHKDDGEPNARPAQVNGYHVRYVHGHDPYRPEGQAHITNLDSDLGKLAPRDEETFQKRIVSDEDARSFEAARKYLVLGSSSSTLHQKHDPEKVEEEFRESFKPASSGLRRFGISALVSLVFFVVGMALGIALVLTGAFAPFGLGIIGSLTLGGILGGLFSAFGAAVGLSVAINTEREVVDTKLPAQDTMQGNSYAGITRSLGTPETVNALAGVPKVPEAPEAPVPQANDRPPQRWSHGIVPNPNPDVDEPSIPNANNDTHEVADNQSVTPSGMS